MTVQPMPGVNVRPTYNDTICKIIRNSKMKCCGIFFLQWGQIDPMVLLTHCYTQPAVRRAEPSIPLLLILAFCQ